MERELSATATEDDARFIFEEWHRATTSRDVEGLLALYTDGIVEAQNREGRDYTVRRLNQLIADHASDPVDEILARCVDDYESFRVADSDDVTLILARRRAR